ncbi:hypothetical protein B0O99DRAFT_61118 [Bisporella sp. PMI_857]|nr:hypothetical protein B0O99DRAFT_61118 [Bisporella sp. PMI_857]
MANWLFQMCFCTLVLAEIPLFGISLRLSHLRQMRIYHHLILTASLLQGFKIIPRFSLRETARSAFCHWTTETSMGGESMAGRLIRREL